MKTPLRSLALSVTVIALAGCSTGGNQAAGGEPAAPERAVAIVDLTFAPATVEVPAGTSVTWTNDDDVPHTVTFDDDAVQSSDQLTNGAAFTTTFEAPGTYDYLCAVHPEMTGTVEVTA